MTGIEPSVPPIRVLRRWRREPGSVTVGTVGRFVEGVFGQPVGWLGQPARRLACRLYPAAQQHVCRWFCLTPTGLGDWACVAINPLPGVHAARQVLEISETLRTVSFLWF